MRVQLEAHGASIDDEYVVDPFPVDPQLGAHRVPGSSAKGRAAAGSKQRQRKTALRAGERNDCNPRGADRGQEPQGPAPTSMASPRCTRVGSWTMARRE
jgi:hypothetical protein